MVLATLLYACILCVSQRGTFQHHLHVDLNIYRWCMFTGHQN
jgi:hypothetical protein